MLLWKLEGLQVFLWPFLQQWKQRVTVILGNTAFYIALFMETQENLSYPSSHFVSINAAHSGAFYKFFSLHLEVLRTNIRIKYIFFRRKLHVNYFIRQGMALRRSVNNFYILVPSEIVWFLVQRIWNKKSPNPCWIPKDLIKNCFSICL